MTDQVIKYHATHCPACNHCISVDFFDGGDQPLATLGWPESEQEAKAMKRLPLEFVRCVECGHIYNRAFSYDEVPYVKRPNRMFNSGTNWSVFLRETHRKIADQLPAEPTVVEIGYGDGGFLSALSELTPSGKFIGFDPHGADVDMAQVETRDALFEPGQHMAELKPDIIISRHVLEHLTNPLGFLQELSFSAAKAAVSPLAYFEVPCIDRVLESGRTVDFYYEHNSQFTTRSFETMLRRAGVEIVEMGHGYEGEVVYALVHMSTEDNHLRISEESREFGESTVASKSAIEQQLTELHASGKTLGVWGGTGKSAAFMCRYGVDAERFPIVVDSDISKAGTFVPGTGQDIKFRDFLKDHEIDVLIIPPQWRARDIIDEMGSCEIHIETILIEHNGRLIDFRTEPHICNVEDSHH